MIADVRKKYSDVTVPASIFPNLIFLVKTSQSFVAIIFLSGAVFSNCYFRAFAENNEIQVRLMNLGGDDDENLYSYILENFTNSDIYPLIALASDPNVGFVTRMSALAVLAPLVQVYDSQKYFSSMVRLLNESKMVSGVSQQTAFMESIYMVLARIDAKATFHLCAERFAADFWSKELIAEIPESMDYEQAVDMVRATSIIGMARIGNEEATQWIREIENRFPGSIDWTEPIGMSIWEANNFLLEKEKDLRQLARKIYNK